MIHARILVAAALLAIGLSVGAQNAPTKTYIVQLADAPVATYDGRGAGPEDPSFADKESGGKPVAYFQNGTQVYGPPPAKWKGVCQTGEGFTAAMCNNKLIGARYYVAGFDSGGGTLTSFEYRSPRSG